MNQRWEEVLVVVEMQTFLFLLYVCWVVWRKKKEKWDFLM